MLPRGSRRFAAALIATSTLAVSACGGDDPTGNSGDALSVAEAQFLLYQFFDVLDLIDIPPLDALPAAGVGPAQTPYGDLYDPVIDGNEQCGGGGSATIDGLISGDVDQQTGVSDIAVSATVDFIGCVIPGDLVTYTLAGAPDVDISADIDITEGGASIAITTNGGIAYSASDGRSGTCSIDLDINASASQGTGVNEVLTGSACGVPAGQLDISLFD